MSKMDYKTILGLCMFLLAVSVQAELVSDEVMTENPTPINQDETSFYPTEHNEIAAKGIVIEDNPKDDLKGAEMFYPFGVGGIWWGRPIGGGWWGYRPGWHGGNGWYRPHWGGGNWGGHWGNNWGGNWGGHWGGPWRGR